MRIRLYLFSILCVAATWTGSRAQNDDAPTKSAFETSAKGWVDLPTTMKEWKRVPPNAKAKLATKNPWSFGDDQVLHCDGGYEMLLYAKVQTNGIFHVEWRFKKAEKTAVKTGILVRTALDGAVWHSAEGGNKTGGAFVGATLFDGKAAKVPKNLTSKIARVNEAGQWNIYEITAKDKTLTLWANGFITAEWPVCDVAKGLIGFRADGAAVEFKNMKFKRVR